jgi:hypothetical protein
VRPARQPAGIAKEKRWPFWTRSLNCSPVSNWRPMFKWATKPPNGLNQPAAPLGSGPGVEEHDGELRNRLH